MILYYFRDVGGGVDEDSHVYSSASDDKLLEIVPLDSNSEAIDTTQNRRSDPGDPEIFNPQPQPESEPDALNLDNSKPLSQHEKELLDALRQRFLRI